jgi:hypothetical protein
MVKDISGSQCTYIYLATYSRSLNSIQFGKNLQINRNIFNVGSNILFLQYFSLCYACQLVDVGKCKSHD